MNYIKKHIKPPLQYILTSTNLPAFIIRINKFEKNKASFTLCDAINPNAAQTTMEWIRQCWEYQFCKGPTPSRFIFSIQERDLKGNVLDETQLSNAIITSVYFHDYLGDNTVCDIDLEVSFD